MSGRGGRGRGGGRGGRGGGGGTFALFVRENDHRVVGFSDIAQLVWAAWGSDCSDRWRERILLKLRSNGAVMTIDMRVEK